MYERFLRVAALFQKAIEKNKGISLEYDSDSIRIYLHDRILHLQAEKWFSCDAKNQQDIQEEEIINTLKSMA